MSEASHSDGRTGRTPTPLFETADAPDLRGRFLLISYHFPPAQTAGSLRWQKLATHVAAAGWGLDVVTAVNTPGETSGGSDRLRDLPAGIRVFGVPLPRSALDGFEQAMLLLRKLSLPSTAASAATSQAGERSLSRAEALHRSWDIKGVRRAYFSWAHYRRERLWADAALAAGERIASARIHDAVISCGPPHMVHVAGRDLAERVGLPFFMDLRDPWSLVERLPADMGSPLWYNLARRAERRCVRDADLIVMNTVPARDAMRAEYPHRAGDIIAVLNGWDTPVAEQPVPAEKPFRIAFAGSISLDRTPDDLFRAAAALIERRGMRPGDIELLFIGPRGDASESALLASAKTHGLSDFVVLEQFLPRRSALDRLATAHVLVSFYQDSHMAVPSKIYEYLTLPGTVLAFATRACATAQVLKDAHAEVVDPADADSHVAALDRIYVDFMSRAARTASPPDQLARAFQARRLLDEMERRLPQRTRNVAVAAGGRSRVDTSATSR